MRFGLLALLAAWLGADAQSARTLTLTGPSSCVVGDTVSLVADARDPKGRLVSKPGIVWASSVPAVAPVLSVSANRRTALVRCLTAGSAAITATWTPTSTSPPLVATQPMTVSDPGIAPVASVRVNPPAPSVIVGATQQFIAEVRDATGAVLSGRLVTWASSNAAIATVNTSGLAIAVGVGTATMTATSEGQNGSATLTIAAAPPPPLTCPSVTDFAPHPQPTLAKPGYLQSVTDPAFGTTITRITGDPGTAIGNGVSGTWPTLAGHHYAKDQPWSADGKLFLLDQMSGAVGAGWGLYLDGETYQPVIARSHPGPEARWHPTKPDTMIYVTATGGAGYWNPRTNASTLRYTSTAYTNAYMGNYEGNPSIDGRYVAVNAVRTADSKGVVFVIDLVAGTKGADIDVVAQGFAAYADLDWASVTPSGNAVALYGTIGGVARRTKLFDRVTGTQSAYWSDYTLGHDDFGLTGMGGTDVAFGAPDGGNGGGALAHRFVARRAADNVVVDLTGQSVTSYNWHASARNTLRPGWGYAVINDRTGYAFDGEIVALNLDGSHQVERWAHHRNNGTDYEASPFAAPNPAGRKIAFRSNWGDATGRPVQEYVVSCPP